MLILSADQKDFHFVSSETGSQGSALCSGQTEGREGDRSQVTGHSRSLHSSFPKNYKHKIFYKFVVDVRCDNTVNYILETS